MADDGDAAEQADEEAPPCEKCGEPLIEPNAVYYKGEKRVHADCATETDADQEANTLGNEDLEVNPEPEGGDE